MTPNPQHPYLPIFQLKICEHDFSMAPKCINRFLGLILGGGEELGSQVAVLSAVAASQKLATPLNSLHALYSAAAGESTCSSQNEASSLLAHPCQFFQGRRTSDLLVSFGGKRTDAV